MNRLTFVCLTLVLLLSPFQWGLFFDANLILWEGIIFLLFIANLIWYIVKAPEVLISNRAYFLVFLLPLMYAFSARVAINPAGNASTLIRFLMYSCFFLMLIWTKATLRKNQPFYDVFHALGLLFLLFSAADSYGLIHLSHSMVGCIPGRLCGPVRYPNTFGAIVGAYWFLLFAALIYRKKVNGLDGFLVILLIGYGLVLLRTVSRGSYIFFAVTLGLAVLLMHRKWKKLGAVFLLALLLIGGFTLLHHDFLSGISLIADTQKSRLFDGGTAVTRIDFYRQAIAMSRQSPLFGFGGNSWPVYYPEHANQGLGLDQVHNGYLDFLIEIGWVGLIVFVSVLGWLVFLISRSKTASPIKIGALLALAMLFGHAMVDYDLSYGTIWLLIFWLIATGLDVKGETGWKK
ncbi:MAG: O-antigen ligase family protein [Sporolactobacillus sp.]|jgi:O-antigen ligase|nr:O-antigen ligase family protein [Sporolactobacillus sp.]